MTAHTNHTKLGVFVLIGIVATIATIFLVSTWSLKKDTVVYYTYFNESVQGLEIGSPVKFRGVTIGKVAGIEVAPDHRHVEVAEELDVADIRRMGLVETGSMKARFLVPPDLRAQLGSQGISGVKFIALDFFDPNANPPPPLAFAPPDRHIPATPSMFKNLEDTITKAMERMPELVDAIVATSGRIDRIIAQLERDDVAGKTMSALSHVDEVLVGIHGTVQRLDKAHLPEKAAGTLDEASVAIGKMNRILDRVDGEAGLVASVTRASDAFGDVGKSAGGTTRELEQTLKEVRDAAEAIRRLADSLERDPDMVLKGRAKAKSR